MHRTFGFALGLLTLTSAAFGQTALVNSFETSSDLAGLVTRGTEVSLTQKGVTDGKSALQIEFNPTSWPIAAFTFGTPVDWSGAGGIAFDVVDLSSTPVYLGFNVYNEPAIGGSNYSWGSAETLSPGLATTVYMPFVTPPNPMDYGMRVLPPPVQNATTCNWGIKSDFDLSHIYSYTFYSSSPPTTQSIAVDNVRLTAPVTAASLNGIIDQYGQISKWSWPGKVTSPSEFVTRAALEATQLAAKPGPSGRDSWGGWAAGPKSTATGYFHTVKVNGKWWLVDPAGNLFFSAGIVGVSKSRSGSATFTQGRTNMFQWLPAAGAQYADNYVNETAYEGPLAAGAAFSFYTANLERKYGSNYTAGWDKTTTARLKSWGFNTLGNWSDSDYCLSDAIPYTAPLGYPSTHAHVPTSDVIWAPMDDAFDPKFAADVASTLPGQVAPYKNDPYCVGYFVDNELSWTGSGANGRYGIAIGALALTASASPAKQAFLTQLQTKYGTIAKFDQAWGTKFTAWSQLNTPYYAPSTLTSAMTTDMGAFVLSFAEKYFQVISSQIKKSDTHHLYLGCRFGAYTPETVQAAAAYCDVVSFNYYATQVDPTDWSFLAGIGKPALISEFNSGATDRGPVGSSLVNAGSQANRAALYQTYANSVLTNPSLVGFHWFDYVDEPVSGRCFDGENFNSGMVDVTDTPYPELTTAAQQLNAQMYTIRNAAD